MSPAHKSNSETHMALIRAAQEGSLPKAQEAIAAGASILFTDEQGLTAAHWAAQRGRAEMLPLLANERVCNTLDTLGRAPLHLAARSGDLVSVEALLSISDAAVNAPDLNERTPLHGAAESGSGNVARLLIDSGASKNARDTEGATPADAAREMGFAALATELAPTPRVSLEAWREGRDQPEAPAVKPKPSLGG